MSVEVKGKRIILTTEQGEVMTFADVTYLGEFLLTVLERNAMLEAMHRGKKKKQEAGLFGQGEGEDTP